MITVKTTITIMITYDSLVFSTANIHSCHTRLLHNNREHSIFQYYTTSASYEQFAGHRHNKWTQKISKNTLTIVTSCFDLKSCNQNWEEERVSSAAKKSHKLCENLKASVMGDGKWQWTVLEMVTHLKTRFWKENRKCPIYNGEWIPILRRRPLGR